MADVLSVPGKLTFKVLKYQKLFTLLCIVKLSVVDQQHACVKNSGFRERLLYVMFKRFIGVITGAALSP
jgi:hypothetical protein